MRQPTSHRTRRTAPAAALLALPALLAGTALLGTGCSSTPPPTAQFAVSSAAIDTARSAGAAEFAAAELNNAQSKLDQARRLAEARRHEPARELAEQAEVDAQVARSKSQAERARRSVTEVEESLRLLREEMNRTQPVLPTAPGTPRTLPAPTGRPAPMSPPPTTATETPGAPALPQHPAVPQQPSATGR
jgi:hypothetical protein